MTDEEGDDPGHEEATAEFAAADLDWRDYVAIVVALGRTVLLPFLVAALGLLALFLLSVYVL